MSTIRRVIFLLVLVCLYLDQEMIAVPAYPYKTTVITHNGKDVEIYMRGDEHIKYAVTKDGYSIVNDTLGWWYINASEDGLINKTIYRLVAEEDETDDLKKFKMDCPKNIIPRSGNVNSIDNKLISRNSTEKTRPVIGKRKALVILMQYKDLAFKYSLDDFDNLFNSENYNVEGAVGSVRDYYSFASQNQLDYQSDIYGPYTTVFPMKFYGANDMLGNDSSPLELCHEALRNLPEGIDLSIYDNNDDGIVDNVHIIFAGYGEEAGASSDAIWSHEYPHKINMNKNGTDITIAGYSCSPELRGNSKRKISHIGVICHELGHALGAMDYYDTNYGTGGEYLGTGKWDIMASGSWNDDGRSPANFNPYVRTAIFGWNRQEVLSTDMQITIPPIESNNTQKAIVYRIDTECDNDYFLIENRQKIYFDEALPGEGLLIYHVHPDINKYTSMNKVNATHPQCFYPVCASGSNPNQRKYGDIDSDGCPFPGIMNNNVFSNQSSPASVAWDGRPSKISLSDITINHNDGSITFSTNSNKIVGPVEPDNPDLGTLVYKESFEGAIENEFDIQSVAGKDVWKTYKKGSFILNSNTIPLPTDGNCLLMLFSPKGGGVSESHLKSPFIQIIKNKNYILSFDVYYDEKNIMLDEVFKFCIEDEFGECVSFTLKTPTKGWSKVYLPFYSDGKYIRYIIEGTVYTGGIFLDNIVLESTDSTGLVYNDISSAEDGYYYVYTINGLFMGYLNVNSLSKGVYLLYRDGKTKKIRIDY